MTDDVDRFQDAAELLKEIVDADVLSIASSTLYEIGQGEASQEIKALGRKVEVFLRKHKRLP